MNDSSRSVEQRILVVMRKVLGSVVKDTAPQPGMRNVLSDTTIEDIRQCFALISAREQELAKEAGITITDRPRFVDEPARSQVVSISSIKKKADSSEGDA
jgi:hypothetical protein